MKTRILYNNWLAKKLLFPGYHTIMLFGLILTKKNQSQFSDIIKNHETIHVFQFTEVTLCSMTILCSLGLLSGIWWLPLPSPFIYYLWYLIEYGLRCIKAPVHQAYRNISFEREAYANEQYGNYIGLRSFMEFIKYL